MEKHHSEELRKARCIPCEGGVPAYTEQEARKQLDELPGWALSSDGKRIRREWMMKNFVEALSFFQEVAELAEAEGHHPDLHLTEYRRAAIELWTHAIGGLSENDFILAAKIDALAEPTD